MAFLFALFIVALSAFVMVIALLAVAAIGGSFGGHWNLKKIEPEQPRRQAPPTPATFVAIWKIRQAASANSRGPREVGRCSLYVRAKASPLRPGPKEISSFGTRDEARRIRGDHRQAAELFKKGWGAWHHARRV